MRTKIDLDKSTNSIPSVNEVVSEMNNTYPKSKKNNRGTSYESIASEYLLKTVNHLCKANITDNGMRELYVSNLNMDYRYSKGRRWITWLKDNYPLFYIVQQGNNLDKSPSKVQLLVSDKELLEYRMNEDFSSLYTANTHSDTLDVKVDIDNLHNYIADCYVRAINSAKGVYRDKLIRNAGQALELYDFAQANDGYLRQCYEFSDFGRLYMKGINLQNRISSEVREAALGKCYKYDISAASYAFRLGYIKHHAPTAKTPALIDLVEYKKRTRQILVKDCLIHTNADEEFKTKIIKKALNAIGFGSRAGMYYGALSDIIYHKQDRMRFIEHPLIKELEVELKLFTELLKQEIPPRTARTFLTGEQRYSQNRFESYVYQQIETAVMQNIMKNCNNDVLMWCHDAIYTTNCEGLGKLNYYLHEQQYMQYASFEQEEITLWQNPFKLAEIYQQHNEHKQRIKSEEQLAQEHYYETM